MTVQLYVATLTFIHSDTSAQRLEDYLTLTLLLTHPPV